MKPTPTTCIDISAGIPNSEQARGINSNDPPATPDAPQADTADRTLSIIAVGISTLIPSVLAAANDSTAIVTAAPAMFIVAPKGIETE